MRKAAAERALKAAMPYPFQLADPVKLQLAIKAAKKAGVAGPTIKAAEAKLAKVVEKAKKAAVRAAAERAAAEKAAAERAAAERAAAERAAAEKAASASMRILTEPGVTKAQTTNRGSWLVSVVMGLFGKSKKQKAKASRSRAPGHQSTAPRHRVAHATVLSRPRPLEDRSIPVVSSTDSDERAHTLAPAPTLAPSLAPATR